MTFKEWEDTAVSEFTCEFGREGIRDVYTTPFGVKVYDEVFLPWNPFKPQHNQTLVDLTYPITELPRLQKTYGEIELDDQRYTEEGFGIPLFKGEGCLERAYNFIEKEKSLVRV
jgi:hypothetical protein